MVKEYEINFNEEKFISLKQASIISGYAKDYIGQLCREEKIKAKRIGRDWFVNPDALISYKREAQSIDVWDKILLSGEAPVIQISKEASLLKNLSPIKAFLKHAILILITLIILEFVFIKNPAGVIAGAETIAAVSRNLYLSINHQKNKAVSETLLAAVSFQKAAVLTAADIQETALNFPDQALNLAEQTLNQVRSLSLSLSRQTS